MAPVMGGIMQSLVGLVPFGHNGFKITGRA